MASSDRRRTKEGEAPGAIRGWGTFAAPGWDPIWLAWSDRGLRRLAWSKPEEAVGEASELPIEIATSLQRYFAGEKVDLARLPLDPIGTEFQRKVWDALLRVPHGAVRTYAGIAQDVGTPRGMRAVGAANGANPIAIVVPCHRIVEVGMKLGGYSGGLDRKRRLLELEGARMAGDVVQPGQLSLL
jgi:methylated-DNA-[protein]-cysteine S-methyltransferase